MYDRWEVIARALEPLRDGTTRPDGQDLIHASMAFALEEMRSKLQEQEKALEKANHMITICVGKITELERERLTETSTVQDPNPPKPPPQYVACNKEVYIQGTGIVPVYLFNQRYYFMRRTGRVVELSPHQASIVHDCSLAAFDIGELEDMFNPRDDHNSSTKI